MNQVLWLSQSDVEKTGVCDLKQTVPIVENTFRLFDAGQAKIVQESALRVAEGDLDQACYCLPVYVGSSGLPMAKARIRLTRINPAFRRLSF